LAIFGFDNDRPDVVIFDGLADVVGELAGRVLRGIKLSPTSTFKQDAALFAEMLSLPKAISARTQRTDGRACLSISLDEAVAPCSFQCAAHSSRLFH
jgi:hypothetical protein